MGQLDPETMAMLSIFLPTVFGSIIVTVLIIRYKLKKKELEMRGSDAELGPEVDALREELAEMQERLDFAERMLAAGRASQDDRSGEQQQLSPLSCFPGGPSQPRGFLPTHLREFEEEISWRSSNHG